MHLQRHDIRVGFDRVNKLRRALAAILKNVCLTYLALLLPYKALQKLANALQELICQLKISTKLK